MSDERRNEPSEEVDERQLELASEAGEGYQRAVEYMIEEVAETGARTGAGDYLLGVAQEEAEGMYRLRDGGLEWTEPPAEANCHLEVVVADAADGRFLPGLGVTATVEDERGTAVGPETLPFLWHPGLFHYGANLAVDGEGPYTVTVTVEPAAFPRHDRRNGDRFADPVEVTFEDLEFGLGRG